MTFSVVGRCPRTGHLGTAITSAVPAVGAHCCFLAAGVGAVVTQSWVNPYLGLDGLDLLRRGASATETVTALVGVDPGAARRQLAVVDSLGGAVNHTGMGNTAWAGARTGPGWVVQGNMLTGAETVDAMAEAYQRHATDPLDERLLAALAAGQRAGGDRRGRQSAALVIHGHEAYPALDLRVDEHTDPVTELHRVHAVALRQLVPYIEMMPTRANPLGGRDADTERMLGQSPDDRPGGR
ncbi:DUF1028 domain-containing protein [Actinokineospora sp. NBRC 105648]|uniref:DUF1028 domain-containing protein n=1 Tax=Actinokineospora sp. NBRC 105648 TaxID=3032206 RepID=UPI0024A02ED2|nr:DUF1028 domain-containing protein [Actinokineospora sp. NBRC 105648]GLZ42289.1 pilus assembly protein [Actinokineospora sp. NBRC 105648]